MVDHVEGLESLVGLSLAGITRALDMGVFFFGPNVTWVVPNELHTRVGSEYAIHIQCPFRLTRNGHILVGSSDMMITCGVLHAASDRESDHEIETAYDIIVDRITQGTKDAPLIVRGVRVELCGDLYVEMSDGVTIEAFPVSARSVEAWRFLKRGGEHMTFPSIT